MAGFAALAVVSALTINIAGTAVPLAAFKGLPQAIVDVVERAPPEKTIKDLLPVIEGVASAFVPGSGIAIAVIVFAIEHQKPPTPQDQQRMWDQAQGIH